MLAHPSHLPYDISFRFKRKAFFLIHSRLYRGAFPQGVKTSRVTNEGTISNTPYMLEKVIKCRRR